MMMSSTDAINFINPAYNPNLESFFPQPLLTSPQSHSDLSVACTGRSQLNVVPLEKESPETLRCEICCINCNSKKVFDNHILGRKHQKKINEQNLEISMFDHVNTEYPEGEETPSAKNIDKDASPCLAASSDIIFGTQELSNQHVTGKEHTLEVESKNHDTVMLEPSSNFSPDISEIQMSKHLEPSSSVADDSCNNKEGDDETQGDKWTLDVVLLKKKSSETLQCEICNISCNSKRVLDNHILGRKHQRKAKEQNLGTSMLDRVTTEYTEGAETKSVNNIDKDALPGFNASSGTTFGTQAMSYHQVSGKKHTLVVESKDRDTIMLEPSSNRSPNVPEIQKHQEYSSSVADDNCKSKEGHDGALADIGQPTQLKAEYSASNAFLVDIKHTDDMAHMNSPSIPTGRVCTVCNIFSNSLATMEKHLAEKTHARESKNMGTGVSLPASGYPSEVLESNTVKPARETHYPADLSSVLPVGCADIEETIHSVDGNLTSSSNLCTTCNINCNSQELFEGHLSGKKHASKVRRLSSCPQTPYLDMKDRVASRKLQLVQLLDHVTDPNANFDDASSIKQMVLQDDPFGKPAFSVNTYATLTTIPAIPPKDDSFASQLYISPRPNSTDEPALQYYEIETTQKASKRGKIVQFLYCDVCKVFCNNSEVLNAHVTGKKHMKQLEKLANLEWGIGTLAKDMIVPGAVDSMNHQDASKSIVSKPNNVVVNQAEVEAPKGIIDSHNRNNVQVTSMNHQDASKSIVSKPNNVVVNQVEVEAAKGIIDSHNRNNVQVTSQDANYGCTLCKVVCNSQMTLSTHFAGKRHAAMLRKAGVSEIVDPSPPARC